MAAVVLGSGPSSKVSTTSWSASRSVLGYVFRPTASPPCVPMEAMREVPRAWLLVQGGFPGVCHSPCCTGAAKALALMLKAIMQANAFAARLAQCDGTSNRTHTMDMLVRLYDLEPMNWLAEPISESTFAIRRALPAEAILISSWVKRTFGAGWAGEASAALSRTPTTCYVALAGQELHGFACWDVSARLFRPSRRQSRFAAQGHR